MPRKVKRQQARYRAYKLGAQSPLAKGVPYRHTIASVYVAHRYEYRLHATKGYRYRRLPALHGYALMNWLLGRL